MDKAETKRHIWNCMGEHEEYIKDPSELGTLNARSWDPDLRCVLHSAISQHFG